MTELDPNKPDSIGEENIAGPIDPIMRRRVGDREYSTRYSHGDVHMDFDPDSVFPEGAMTKEILDGYLWYKFLSKTPVVLTPDGVMMIEGTMRHNANNQAYFVLSMLAEQGQVERFIKQ